AQVTYAFPAGGVGEVASVHEHLDARQVIWAELGVGAVVGLHDRGVDVLAQVIGLQPVGSQLGVGEQRVVHEGAGAGLGERRYGRYHPGERGLLHSAAVGGTENDDGSLGQVAERTGEHAHGIGGHGHVRLSGGAHHCCVWVGPQVQPRVDGDAVPAHGDAGPVDVGVGLGVGGGDHLVHIDAVGGGEGAELVRQ